jgi:hypothetical protein
MPFGRKPGAVSQRGKWPDRPDRKDLVIFPPAPLPKRVQGNAWQTALMACAVMAITVAGAWVALGPGSIGM